MRPVEPDWDEARILYERAYEAMLQEEWESAVNLFIQSNSIQPHYKTCLHLGECYVQMKRYHDAIIPFAAATALNRQGIAPFKLAEVFLALDEPDKAHEFVKLAIDRQPELKRARELEPEIRDAVERRNRELWGDESH